ncbi:hypothetical protein HDU91_003217 [Kappamyces sp. JEL0680]|nr:hypothetical protein HDU91_003217 [Kappamyces sp. JEL0680]
MNAEMGGNMLKEICVYDPSRGWVFKLPDDESFGELHPDIQEKQHELLGNLAEKALLTFAALAAKTGSNSSTSSVGLPVPAAKTHSAKKLQAISSSLLELYELEGATSQDQSQNLIKQMLKKHGVLHRPHMHQIFHHQAKQGGDDNMLGQVSQSSIDSIISNLGFEIRPDVFALTSVGNSTLDPLRKVTMRMYTTKDVIKKADMIEAWVEATSSRPSDVIYKKVMAEFGLPRPGGHWRLKGLADA